MVRIPTIRCFSGRLARMLSVLGALFYGMPFGLHAEHPQAIEPSLQPAVSIKGSLVIAGGGALPDSVIDRFFELGGKADARIVIITTASQLAGTPEVEVRFEHWKLRKYQSLTYLHTRDRAIADDPKFSECLTNATAVWFAGGNQNLVTEAYKDTLVEKRCHDLLHRGGVIGGTSAGAAIMSRTMIAGGWNDPAFGVGLGFLPGTIIDQHFAARNRQGRLMTAINTHPGHVGIGINECTALVVRGRIMEVVGDSNVAICLSATHLRPERVQTLEVGKQEDLVRLSRAAIGRIQEQDRSYQRPHPEVRKGTLVISGTGPTPKEAAHKFLSAAGGRDASIVVLSASQSDDIDDSTFCEWLRDAGASEVHQLSADERADDTVELGVKQLHHSLKQATGVWIADSHLSRLVESYLDTPIHKLVADVLHRGGAIGGTSAGAAIQGDYLVDDGIAENQAAVAEGYQRGFGFLPGVAIGSQRRDRESIDDLTRFKRTHSGFIGLEVPEATALIVSGTKMEVVGKNEVAVYDRYSREDAYRPTVELVKAGQSYDFKQRRLIEVVGNAP